MADAAQSKRPDLTHGPIGRSLLLFALPTLASSILQSLNGSINSVWVGRFLGENALAATSNANFIMFLLMAFVFGFGMAATVIIGQAFWGRHDIDGARRVMGTAIGAFVPIALAIAIIGWVGSPAIASAAGHARRRHAAGACLFAGDLHGDAGDPAADHDDDGPSRQRRCADPMWFMILAVILDVGLNPVFILGLGPVATSRASPGRR